MQKKYFLSEIVKKCKETFSFSIIHFLGTQFEDTKVKIYFWNKKLLIFGTIGKHLNIIKEIF